MDLVRGSTDHGYVACYADKVVNYSNSSVEGDFVFTVNNGVNTLVEYLGSSATIVLPDSYNGENYMIDDNVFKGNTTITSVTIPDGVTSIGGYAFEGCSGLTSVTIPGSVTSIGGYAFGYCTGLTSVTIPAGVTSIGPSAFRDCTGLTRVEIPGSVTSIGWSAFQGCSGLTSVVIPTGVTGDYAFYGCSGLTSVVIGDGVTRILASAFWYCTALKTIYNFSSLNLVGGSADHGYVAYYADFVINAPNGSVESDFVFTVNNGVNTLMGYIGSSANIVLPDSYKGENYVIGNNVFKGNTTITSVTIPTGVTSIGSSAFSGCTGLTSVVIPAGVTSIGSSAFEGCTGLTSVVIPTGVTNIGSSAFEGCTGLTSVEIPGSVTSIGESAFYGCRNLKTVYNFSSLDLVRGSTDHGYVAYYADKVVDYSNSSVEGDFVFTVNNGVNTLVKYLGSSATIVLPDSYKGENYVIDNNVFNGNTTITSVTIPDCVTSIGLYAFKGCTRLASIVIGNGVTRIGSSAFQGCSNLKTVYNLSSLNLVKGSTDHGYVAYYADKVINVPNGSLEGEFVFVTAKVAHEYTTSDGLPGTVQGNNHVWESPLLQGTTDCIRITVLATNGGSNMYQYNGYPIVALGELEFYDGNGNKITYTGTDVATNSLEGTEGSLANLCDGDYSTYYHSTWSGTGTTPNGNVYLDVKFPVEVDGVKIKMVGRDTKSLVPNHIKVELPVYTNALKAYIGSSSDVVLPDSYKGENYAIADSAFINNTTITSVTIPAGVTGIGRDAFKDCTNITDVYFESNPFIAGSAISSTINRHLVLNDSNAADFNADNVNTFTDVSYTRSTSEGRYGTIILPFAPDAESLEHYAFYALVESGEGYIRFEEVDAPVANTPYLYTLREGEENTSITGGETVISSEMITPEQGCWETVGSFTSQTVDCTTGNFFAFSPDNNEINRITNSLKVLPYRAYFKNTVVAQRSLRILIGGTTGVEEVEVEKIDGFNIYFDLGGRRITEPVKGKIYIKNGKKIMF